MARRLLIEALVPISLRSFVPFVLALSFGCADSPPSPYRGADGGDAARPDGSADANVSPPDAAPPTCPPPAPGTLPRLNGSFVQTAGASASSPPAMTGGNPTGTWASSQLTIYLPAAAQFAIDATRSTVSGTGWFAYEAGGVYRYTIDVDVNVATLSGMQMQHVTLGSVGTYTVSGTQITSSPQCQTGGEGAGVSAPPRTEFTAGTGAASQFLITVPTQYGDLLFLFNASTL